MGQLKGVCTSLDNGSGPRSPGKVGLCKRGSVFSSGGAPSLAQLSYETRINGSKVEFKNQQLQLILYCIIKEDK